MLRWAFFWMHTVFTIQHTEHRLKLKNISWSMSSKAQDSKKANVLNWHKNKCKNISCHKTCNKVTEKGRCFMPFLSFSFLFASNFYGRKLRKIQSGTLLWGGLNPLPLVSALSPNIVNLSVVKKKALHYFVPLNVASRPYHSTTNGWSWRSSFYVYIVLIMSICILFFRNGGYKISHSGENNTSISSSRATNSLCHCLSFSFH